MTGRFYARPTPRSNLLPCADACSQGFQLLARGAAVQRISRQRDALGDGRGALGQVDTEAGVERYEIAVRAALAGQDADRYRGAVPGIAAGHVVGAGRREPVVLGVETVLPHVAVADLEDAAGGGRGG